MTYIRECIRIHLLAALRRGVWIPLPDTRFNSWGEHLDDATKNSIRITYKVLERFPDLVRRHKVISGGLVVCSALITLTSVAVVRRLRNGESEQEVINGISEEEIEGSIKDREETAARGAEST